MTTRVWSAVLIGTLVATGVSLDLRGKARAAARKPAVAVSASTGTRTFADPKSGIAVCYPAAWHPQTSKTAELAVAAPTCDACLQLDVPAMGWHPPFIPVGMVAAKYVEALKQSDLPDGAVQETTDLKVAGATARRVTTHGHARCGTAVVDTALVIVHAGQVYILSCDSDEASTATARQALDAAAASVRWTK